MSIERCRDCYYWHRVSKDYAPHPAAAAGGECNHPKVVISDVADYEPDSIVYGDVWRQTCWTGPDFGCVHHKPR